MRCKYTSRSTTHYPVHEFQIFKIIKETKDVQHKYYVPICLSPTTEEDTSEKLKKYKMKKGKGDATKKKSAKNKMKENANEKGKKGENKKRKKGGVLNIMVPGEAFFTDPTLSIYDYKNSDGVIRNCYILTTIENLMTRNQKYVLNPLIIKIKKISNLPVEVLIEHKFSNIYIHCNIPYVAQCTTLQKPVAESIKYNEAHAHFTDDVPRATFVEFLQSHRMHVEIRGVRENVSKSVQPLMFGYDKDDIEISKKVSPRQCSTLTNDPKKEDFVVLAVACYNLSSLLKPTWDFSVGESCHNPNNILYQKMKTVYENFEYADSITTNEVNLGFRTKYGSESPLSEGTLLELGTSLQVEVYLSSPYIYLLQVQSKPEIFSRLFAVIYDKNLAKTLLKAILRHNQEVLGPDVIVYNFLKGKTYIPTHETNTQSTFDGLSTTSQAVTGFLIDNGDTYALFVEGLATGLISNIWDWLMYLNKSLVKTFYNSELVFECRIYSDFLMYGGMYIITLKASLCEILSQERMYCEGNVPISCWQALKKLDVLFRCPTIRAMTQYSLFPRSIELLSLDIEWGVPLKYTQNFLEIK